MQQAELIQPLNYVPLSERVSPAARKILMSLASQSVQMYALETCQVCWQKLTIDEINDSITKGVPPLCAKHQVKMQQQFEQLAPMMQNLRLL